MVAILIVELKYMNKTRTKPSLIILPGWGGNEMLWQHQIEHLQDIIDVRVITVTTADTIDKMAEAVLNDAPGNFSVVGHSIGGWVAQFLAIHFPEKINKLILVSTWTGQSMPDLNNFFIKALQCLKNNQRAELLKEVTSNLFYQYHTEKKALLNLVEKSQARFPTEGLINQLLAEMNSRDTVGSLHKIKCPTLLIYGHQDPFFTLKEQEAIKTKIPRAKLAVIEECGHMPSIERPQALTALIRLWLE